MIDMVVDPETTEYSYVKPSSIKSSKPSSQENVIAFKNYYFGYGVQIVTTNRIYVWSRKILPDAFEKKESPDKASDLFKLLKAWPGMPQVENKKEVLREHDRVKYYKMGEATVRSEVKERKILDALRATGQEAIAEELDDLVKVIAQYPEVNGVDINSMDSMARFFLENMDIPIPTIASDSDGILGLEWRLPLSIPESEHNCDGILCMDFLPSGDIEFTGDAIATEEYRALDISGEATHENVIDKIDEFLQRLR